jgi:adenylate cyclase
MGIEIERKFLVDHKQWQQLPKPAGTKMQQGYMVNEDDRTIRLRITWINRLTLRLKAAPRV